MIDIANFEDAVLKQDREAIRSYFATDAYVNWHNTGEHFTVEEFIRANCEYPGEVPKRRQNMNIGSKIK